VKHISDSGEENEKLLIFEDSKQNGKITAKNDLLDDGESKASRQSDARQTVSNLKENIESVQVTNEETEIKILTKQTSMKVVTKEISAESKEDKDNKRDDIKSLQKIQTDEKQKTEALTFTERSTDKYLDEAARGKSADLSSTESKVSTLNAEESLSPEKMSSPRDKKSERIKRDDRERLEAKTGKLPK